MADLIKLRRGTAAQWAATNPVLATGEAGYDSTNNELRIGNGTTQWSGLTPIAATVSSEAIQDAVGSIVTDSATINFTYDDTSNTITGDVTTQQSVTSDASGVKLSGDTATPGASKYYGTDSGGTRGWNTLPAGITSEDAQDAVGGALTDSNTVDFTYNDGANTITADAKTQMSVTSDASGLKLSGDSATPGNSKYYGTNSSGTKGWNSLPAAAIDTTGHAAGTEELYWDETSGTVKLRAPSPAVSLARKLDIRSAAYGGQVDGRLLPGATTSSSTTTTVTFAAVHGITVADIGKTGWVLDSTGNGTNRTIAAVPTTTSITLSGQSGKTVTSGQFVYGTPIDTAAAAALTAAGNMVTVDMTAGANKPAGPVSGVEVYCGGGTGIAILTAQLHVPHGVRWNNDGIIYGGNLTTSPFFLLDSNTSIGRLTIDVGTGRGLIWGDSTSSQVHGSWDRIEVWNRGGDSTKHLIELDGLDYQGHEIWTKGGGTAVRCVSGTDSNLGHIFAIGASTGVAISAGSQITGHIFSDSCSTALRIWGGADNVELDVQAFMTSSSPSGTTKVVVFSVKDDTTTSTSLNQNIRLNVQARDIGEVVVGLAYCQNVKVRGMLAPRLSAGSIVQSGRGTMTGINYGTSVGDGIDVELSFPSFTQTLDDGTTPAYSLYTGTPTGRYRAIYDGKDVIVTGRAYRMTGGTATVPTVSEVVTDLDLVEMFHLLTTGQETIPGARALNSSNTIGMTSGSSRLTYFTARKSGAYTSIKLFSGSTVSSGLTIARAAIHSVASNGDTTVLASTTNDTTLFAATNTAYTKSLSATVNLVRGNRYAFELLELGTPGNKPGMAAFSGTGGSSTLGAHTIDEPRVAALINGQTDIGTGYTAAAIAAATNAGATSSTVYAVLVP